MDEIETAEAVQQPARQPEEPESAAAPLDAEGVVERWWEDHFPGSPVAQVTAAWNHAFAAKEDLKRRLKGI